MIRITRGTDCTDERIQRQNLTYSVAILSRDSGMNLGNYILSI